MNILLITCGTPSDGIGDTIIIIGLMNPTINTKHAAIASQFHNSECTVLVINSL